MPDAAGLLVALPSAVLALDRGGTVLFVNPAAEQFFGSGASTLCLLMSRDPVQGFKTVAWGENVLSIRKPTYKVPNCCLSDCEREETGSCQSRLTPHQA